ncbi:MAG: 2-hydroxyhepta-2,4-diene-1,7-dioate isomerase [Crocinitomicaceae bacterium]|nr:2-hydroxyhepta-2,4-diene-1,7-dioate isomerase [Crocinitomicaceae bacterium]
MKLICIGRNYADHASELGNAVPAEPLFFLKPDSAVLPHRHPFYIPAWTNEVHHEVELVVRITRNGKGIAPEFAHRYFDEVSLGIDFTARDVQSALKANGHPWEKAKAFDGSAVLSKTWIPKATWEEGWEQAPFALKKNGQVVQSATAQSMLFHVHDLIAYVSKYMTLKMGDILFTGTPAGVGPVADGDILEGLLNDQSMFRVQVHG